MNDFDPSLYQDNGDGTYTDPNTGYIYDADGNLTWAGAVATPAGTADNTAAVTQPNLEVPITSAADAPAPGSGTAALENVLQTIESAFTDLTPALQASGLIKSPAVTAAAAQTAAQAAATRQASDANLSLMKEVVVGLIVVFLGYKLIAKA